MKKVVAILLFGVGMLMPSILYASVPGELHYQGYITNAVGDPVDCADPFTCPDGYTITFSLYASESGGTPLWTESHTDTSIIEGVFHLNLGSDENLGASLLNGSRWFGISINEGNEMSPRQKIASAPFAIRADVAGTASQSVNSWQLGGVDSTEFVQVQQVVGLCVTESELDTILLEKSYCSSCFTNSDVAGYLTENGYVPDPHFSGSFTDLTDVPADLSDGDADTLAALGCSSGQSPRWDGAIWVCGNAQLSPDSLGTVSNQLLTNQFVDTFGSTGTPVDIPDNNPLGVGDELVVPDIGVAQTISITLHVTNSDLSTVKALLFDPDNEPFTLFDVGDVSGTEINTAFPDPSPVSSGDLTSWYGKNPTGTWRIQITDGGFLNNSFDGQLVSWSVHMQTLSNQKVAVQGDLIVNGKVQGDLITDGTIKTGSVQFDSAAGEPIPCDASTEGTVYYDAAVKNLRMCNGTEYLRLRTCSETCPDVSEVGCGATVNNGCGEVCGLTGSGLNSTQCLINAATTGCNLLVTDDCSNDCGLTGTSLDLATCPAAGTVPCDQPIVDLCGNSCGSNGTGYDASLCVDADITLCGLPLADSCANPCPGTGTACPGASDVCNGTSCVEFGKDPSNPGLSCKNILDNAASSASGSYWIDPDGLGGLSSMEVHCDMVNEGGGWTLCASLTKGYVPLHMLMDVDRYAFQARKSSNDNYVFETEAPARTTATWDNSEDLNYGAFCRHIGSSVAETKIEMKNWNFCNNGGSCTKNAGYSDVRSGIYTGNTFNQWFNNTASGSFAHSSGHLLTICTNDNAYGGPYTTKSVGWSGGGGHDCSGNSPYTHSSNAWGEASGGCSGCTSTSGFYNALAYGQTTILNNLSHPFWSGIPNAQYGWSDCTANGNCDYEESGYGVWLLWVR